MIWQWNISRNDHHDKSNNLLPCRIITVLLTTSPWPAYFTTAHLYLLIPFTYFTQPPLATNSFVLFVSLFVFYFVYLFFRFHIPVKSCSTCLSDLFLLVNLFPFLKMRNSRCRKLRDLLKVKLDIQPSGSILISWFLYLQLPWAEIRKNALQN